MGSDKIYAKKKIPDYRPQRFKGGLSLNMFPGDAVYGREEERISFRADEVIFLLHKPSAGDANETDCASAIGSVVGCLEIDSYESQGAPRDRGSADWRTATCSLTATPPRGRRV